MADQYVSRRQNEQFTTLPISNGDYKTILNEVISKVLITENIRMSDVSFESLVIHLLIAIERIKTNNIVILNNEVIHTQQSKIEFQTAKSLQAEIEKYFGIILPESEVAYLSQHLAGKKHFETDEEDFNDQIDDETKIIVNTILRAIFDQTRIDFYNDLDLKMNLLLHIIPFMERVENNMQLKNPIINDIKENYSFAYELASIGLHSVCDKLQIQITEEEISYFALHFTLALERANEKVKHKILIVCNTGKATSQLLAYQVQKHFETHINSIHIIESYLIKNMDISSFDFIFSTVPLEDEYSIPVYYINNILANEDLSKISDVFSHTRLTGSISHLITEDLLFTDIEAETKEEALAKLICAVSKIKKIPENLTELVLEREHFASTELTNLVAIPHPNKAVTEETFIAVGILKKPIHWHTKKVQIMFLICIKPNNKGNLRDFYEALVDFTTNEDNLKALIEDPSYSNLIQRIEIS